MNNRTPNYYAYPADRTRPVFHEEALLFDADRQIRTCPNAERLPSLKHERAVLRKAFVTKVAKYYGLLA